MAATLIRTLCILGLAAGAYTNPMPTPPPIRTGTSMGGEIGALGTPTCTTTLTFIVTGFQGDFTAKIVKTIYTKTVTEHMQIDCGGCALSITTELAKFWGGFGPQEIITATRTAIQASTTTLTACSRDSVPPLHGQIPRDVNDLAVSSSGECTFTKVIVPTPHLLGEETKTVYTTTATVTSHIDCGGCNYIAVSTADFLHPGPMVPHSTTITASTPAAETAYVCLRSPSVVLPPSSSPGARRATISSPPPVTSAANLTIHKTITKTIYAATVTVVKTASCGPMHGPGSQTSQGAIPKRDDLTSEKKTSTSNSRTPTVYSTLEVSNSATWTRTSFHCVERRPNPTAIPSKGTLAEIRERAATTTPPTHKPRPVSPSGTTATITFSD